MRWRTDEGVLVSELKVEADEVEEANKSGAQHGPVRDEASRNEGIAGELALIDDEADEDDWADGEHGNDLSA